MNAVAIFSFLKELKKNNNRDWFQENKAKYQQAFDHFLDIAQFIIDELGKSDKEISLLQPKDCVFRIYRDVRFSHDKTPYKTHFGAYFAPGGKGSPNPGYYLHLSPGGESFMGGGLYRPTGEMMAKVRQEIDYNSGELKKIVSKKQFSNIFGEIQGDSLVRPPKGYSADHPQIELLKLKDYLVLSNLKDSEVKEKNFTKEVVKRFRIMQPFIEYLSVAIS